MMKKTTILEVAITNESEEDISEYLMQRMKDSKEKLFIVTPNPEILVYAHKHPQYKRILNKADVALPDGVGLFVASGLLGDPLQQRIPGVDFIEELCRKCEKNPLSMGFLGGGSGVARATAECLIKKYPWIKVQWVGEEWGNEAVEAIKHNRIDILFVAFGFPKQEEWIYKNLPILPVKCAMGVGGAFDYISGHVVRAPFILRFFGFEWLFRLIRQPWRIKRQQALLEFVVLIIKEIRKKIKEK